jgi:hypothetical protein
VESLFQGSTAQPKDLPVYTLYYIVARLPTRPPARPPTCPLSRPPARLKSCILLEIGINPLKWYSLAVQHGLISSLTSKEAKQLEMTFLYRKNAAKKYSSVTGRMGGHFIK